MGYILPLVSGLWKGSLVKNFSSFSLDLCVPLMDKCILLIKGLGEKMQSLARLSPEKRDFQAAPRHILSIHTVFGGCYERYPALNRTGVVPVPGSAAAGSSSSRLRLCNRENLCSLGEELHTFSQ